REDASVVVLLEIAPADILADFGVRLERDSELHESLDLTVQHLLRENPVRDAAAIQASRLRRFLQDRHCISEARELVRGAVAGRSGSDDRDLLAVRRSSLYHVVRQCLAEIAEEPLDGADRNRLVVLAAIARLLARVVADAAGDRRKRH